MNVFIVIPPSGIFFPYACGFFFNHQFLRKYHVENHKDFNVHHIFLLFKQKAFDELIRKKQDVTSNGALRASLRENIELLGNRVDI